MTPNDTGKRRRGEAAVVAALALGATYEDAATEAGVSKSTVVRWMREPEFRAHVDELATAGMEQARRILSGGTPAAARWLVTLATEPASAELLSPMVRRLACLNVLDLAHRWRERHELEQRIAAIEERLGL